MQCADPDKAWRDLERVMTTLWAEGFELFDLYQGVAVDASNQDQVRQQLTR